MISLVSWLKETTFCTLYEAAKSMLPAGIGLNYVVSFMANKLSESEELSLKNDESRVYTYLKEKCKFIPSDKIYGDLGIAPDTKLLEKMVRCNILITNVDTKRKTGDLTVKNVRLAISEEEAENVLKTLTVKQKSVLSLLIDIGGASVKEVCYFTGVTQAVISSLHKKGLVELFDSEIYRKPRYEVSDKKSQSPQLTPTSRYVSWFSFSYYWVLS